MNSNWKRQQILTDSQPIKGTKGQVSMTALLVMSTLMLLQTACNNRNKRDTDESQVKATSATTTTTTTTTVPASVETPSAAQPVTPKPDTPSSATPQPATAPVATPEKPASSGVINGGTAKDEVKVDEVNPPANKSADSKRVDPPKPVVAGEGAVAPSTSVQAKAELVTVPTKAEVDEANKKAKEIKEANTAVVTNDKPNAESPTVSTSFDPIKAMQANLKLADEIQSLLRSHIYKSSDLAKMTDKWIPATARTTAMLNTYADKPASEALHKQIVSYAKLYNAIKDSLQTEITKINDAALTAKWQAFSKDWAVTYQQYYAQSAPLKDFISNPKLIATQTQVSMDRLLTQADQFVDEFSKLPLTNNKSNDLVNNLKKSIADLREANKKNGLNSPQEKHAFAVMVANLEKVKIKMSELLTAEASRKQVLELMSWIEKVEQALRTGVELAELPGKK